MGTTRVLTTFILFVYSNTASTFRTSKKRNGHPIFLLCAGPREIQTISMFMFTQQLVGS